MALHETNHSVRWSFVDPYVNFRNWVIFEGLAECYLAEIQPNEPLSPWVTTAKTEDLIRLGPTVKAFWDGFDTPKGEPHEWFFGSELLGVPKWFGYALGFHLVSEHRKNNQNQSWAEYIKTPSEEFDKFIKQN